MGRTALAMILLNTLCTGLLFGITGNNIWESRSCSWHLFMWPLVLGALHFFLLLYYIVYLVCALLLPFPAIRVAKRSMDTFYCLFPLTFYVAWLVWGNIIVFKKAWGCRYEPNAQHVFRLMLAWIVLGWILWALYLCAGCCMFCGLLGKMAKRKGRENLIDVFGWFGRDIDDAEGYGYGRVSKVPERCTICGNKFQENDDMM